MIGNCPKLNFSLITAPSPYWKQISTKNFPVYESLACRHCFTNAIDHRLAAVTDSTDRSTHEHKILPQKDTEHHAWSWKFVPFEVGIFQVCRTRVVLG